MWGFLGFKSKFQKGAKVEAVHPESGKYLPATVTADLGNNQYSLDFEGGESVKKISGDLVRKFGKELKEKDSPVTTKQEPSAATSNSRKLSDASSVSEKGPRRRLSSEGASSKIPKDNKDTVKAVITRENSETNIKPITRLTSKLDRPITNEKNENILKRNNTIIVPVDQPVEEVVTKPPEKKVKKPKIPREKEEITVIARIRKCREEKLLSIDLSHLKLKSLPNDLLDLDLLELIIRKTEFESLDGLANFSDLETLDLAFSTLPSSSWMDQLQYLPKLKKLDLSCTNLDAIPEQIRYCTRLQVLILRRNSIKEIPDWINQLRHLHTFDLSNNQIDNIPIELESLPMLSDLNILNNHCDGGELSDKIRYLIAKVSIHKQYLN
jgi:Leucine-rich repeat (LRR) protein